MAVTFNNLVNDDGSNTVGTLIDKAQFQLLLMGAVVTSTSTGAQNNWAPGLDGHTLFTWAGASDAAVTGLATGTAGQIAMIRNTSTTKVITFAHLSGSSSAANQFTNSATSGVTPVAPGGWIIYRHTGTNWQLVAHEQGAWITPTYAAGDFTAATGTWTVDSGDRLLWKYRLAGRTLHVKFSLGTTSVSATPVYLLGKIPGGYTSTADTTQPMQAQNAGAATAVGAVSASATDLAFFSTIGGGPWGTATNNTAVNGTHVFEVT
jgi:hypothetical protein